MKPNFDDQKKKVFSILLKMWNENLDEKDRFLFRNMVLAAENKKYFSWIRKWEKVILSFEIHKVELLQYEKRAYKYDLVASKNM